MSALMKEIILRFTAEDSSKEKLIVNRFRQDSKLFLPNPCPKQEAQLQQPTEQLENWVLSGMALAQSTVPVWGHSAAPSQPSLAGKSCPYLVKHVQTTDRQNLRLRRPSLRPWALSTSVYKAVVSVVIKMCCEICKHIKKSKNNVTDTHTGHNCFRWKKRKKKGYK